jgi:hypothetical protein
MGTADSAEKRAHNVLIVRFVESASVKSERGVTYSRPDTDTGIPSLERFRTRPSGRISNVSSEPKLPVLCRTAAEAQICFRVLFT